MIILYLIILVFWHLNISSQLLIRLMRNFPILNNYRKYLQIHDSKLND